jgi:hypothetical protein
MSLSDEDAAKIARDAWGRVVDGLDVWWVCTKPNCTWFSSDKAERDAHYAACPGQRELPF